MGAGGYLFLVKCSRFELLFYLLISDHRDLPGLQVECGRGKPDQFNQFVNLLLRGLSCPSNLLCGIPLHHDISKLH